MDITLIDHMGTDLSVVNAARVSFANESSLEEYEIEGREPYTLDVGGGFHVRNVIIDNKAMRLRAADVSLIGFLARENHWSPFAHTSVSLRIKAPLFVVRQLAKHQVGLSWNEVSRRYVSSTPEFFMPDVWRKKADNVKQGSADERADFNSHHQIDSVYDDILTLYEDMLFRGVCPEQARMILPQSMYTEFIWTGSMLAFSRVCGLRCKSDTQRETQEIANMISDIVEPLFPVSWEALNG